MSFEAYKAVWSTDCTGGIKLTLLAIAEFASKKNGYTCEASIETLAEMVGTSDRQIKRNLKALEDGGYITILRQVGRGNTNVCDISHLLKGDTQDTFSDDKKVSPMSPLNQEKVTSEAEKVTSKAIKGVTDVTQTIYNPKNHIYIEPDPEPIAKIKTALSKVSKTPNWNKTADDYDEAAYLIAGYDATPDDVATFGKWWETNGHYSGKPALKSVLQEFPNFMRAVRASPNGKHEPDPELEAMIKSMEVESE